MCDGFKKRTKPKIIARILECNKIWNIRFVYYQNQQKGITVSLSIEQIHLNQLLQELLYSCSRNFAPKQDVIISNMSSINITHSQSKRLVK